MVIARAICSIKEKRECLQKGSKVNFSHLEETSPCLLADGKRLIEGWTDSKYKRRKDTEIINRLRQ